MSRRNKPPADPRPAATHAAAEDLAEGPAQGAPPPRLGATVLWRVPEEWRRYDTAERLGAEVPALVARVHPDGVVDLHPLRVELTWRVPPGDCRPLED